MMRRFSHPVERTAYDARLLGIAALAVVFGLAAVLQRTELAPFPPGWTDFLGGVAVGLGVAVVWGRALSRA